MTHELLEDDEDVGIELPGPPVPVVADETVLIDVSDIAPPDELLGMTDDALALYLGEHGGWNENARYVSGWEDWVFWNEDAGYWKRHTAEQAQTQVRTFLRELAQDIIVRAKAAVAQRDAAAPEDEGEHEKAMRTRANQELLGKAEKMEHSLRSAAKMNMLERLARSNPASHAEPMDFDADPYLLSVPGGTVDLRTCELREARREDMITMQTRVAPDPNMTTPHFTMVLQTLSRLDPYLIDYLQRSAYWTLLGTSGVHAFNFFVDPGRSGKSTYNEALFYALGDYSGVLPSDALMVGYNTGGHKDDLDGIRGKRLVIGSEIATNAVFNDKMLKQLTGGDTMRISAKGEKGYYTRFPMSLSIAGQSRPGLRDNGPSFRQRLKLIDMTGLSLTPEQQDDKLPERLQAEAPGILHWMLQGRASFEKLKLMPTPKMSQDAEDYHAAEDVTGAFIEERLTYKAGERTFLRDVADLYRAFSERIGITGKPYSNAKIIQELKAKGLVVTKSGGYPKLFDYKMKPESEW